MTYIKSCLEKIFFQSDFIKTTSTTTTFHTKYLDAIAATDTSKAAAVAVVVVVFDYYGGGDDGDCGDADGGNKRINDTAYKNKYEF